MSTDPTGVERGGVGRLCGAGPLAGDRPLCERYAAGRNSHDGPACSGDPNGSADFSVSSYGLILT